MLALVHGVPHATLRKTTAGSDLPILVLSERVLFRDCVVEFLRSSGFVDTASHPTRYVLTRRTSLPAPRLVIIEIGEDDTGTTETVSARLRSCWSTATVIAIGTPIQLAAHARDADGWIESSEPGARLTAMARGVARSRPGRARFKPSSEVERAFTKWSAVTRRQREVLSVVARGADNQNVATALGISVRAVKAHMGALLKRFRVASRTQLAIIACRAGFCSS